MRLKLTNAIINKHRKGYLWDAIAPGLGLRIRAEGDTARWVFIYQWGGRGHQRALGPYPGVTLEAARRVVTDGLETLAAARLNNLVSDPFQDSGRQGITVKTLCARYMDEESSINKRTWGQDQRRITKHLLPRWATLPAAELTRQQVRDMLQELKGTPYEANRTLALISTVWNWGISNDHLPNVPGPTMGVKRFKERSRDRWVSREEMPRLLEAIDAQPCPFVRAAFKTLLATGMRKGEVRGLRWDWVDRARGVVIFPAEAVKSDRRQEVPIAPAVLEIWGEGTGLVFSTSDTPINLDKPWQGIRAAADLLDVNIHDLRRTAASWMMEYQGVSIDVIGGILRHQDTKTTKRYAHLGDDRKANAMENHAGDILGGGE